AVLDSSIVNVALPNMSGTLGCSIEEITWVVTAYILSNVIIMPIIALLSARFGRKKFYLASVVLFTASSMACGLARSLPTMVLFRVLQGVGGGVLQTVSQAILRETFPPEEQGIAMGLFGMGAVVAPAVGPTLGGWLTDNYAWPWIFYINVPIGVLNVVLVSRFVHDPAYLVREKGRIDWLGLFLMTFGLGALQLMLEKGETEGWFDSRYIVTLAGVAGVGLAGFVWRELVTSRPAVNLRLLKDATFASATVMGGILGLALNASLFLLPVFLQRFLGYPAVDSGLALMPRSAAMIVLMPLGGALYNRLGPRVLVGSGLIISTYSFWRLGHLAPDIGFWDIFMPQLWQGIGFSLIFVALSTAALAGIARPEITAASGLYNVVRQISGSVGIAAAATMISRGTVRYRSVLAERVTLGDVRTQAWLHAATGAMQRAGADAATAAQRALRLLDLYVTRQASLLAYNHVYQLITASFALCLPLVLLLRRPRGHVEVEIGAE
ncbi:MAG: family efflux transporter permease subunit, partial [bacterium]|nr:family efflux transporter permease subunit [bacterium]